ncbi:serpin family protein [Gemmata sp. G18]|uniref:Serpin family protein n=1 Tax=Gemmata palustris TaxID=2822762 RepID=A0ABS5BX11_9BACT|nr:serpin family protein [Gemmata palustris]MBP3958277.1 serpin family protein [Gemmata palustris]
MRSAHSSPTPDPKDLSAAVDGLRAFATDLYAQLRADSGNLLVSPYSIGTALAMAAAGARGSTFDEMQKVLHLPAAEKLGAAYRGLAATIATPQLGAGRTELIVANALWAQQDHPWKVEYLARVRTDFQAELFGADFRTAARDVPARINRWVEERTRNRIRNLIAPGVFDHNTRAVLTNAIYFKSRWANVFQTHDTKPADFILSTGAQVKCSMMYQRTRFGLLESEALQILRLPYDDFSTSMYILLPREPDGLPDLERQLTAVHLTGRAAINNATDVKVWLPKFTFPVPTELTTTLQRMGVTEAFDSQKANFQGMTDHPEGLFLNRVIHKAFVAVDEIGTVAAAATGCAGGGCAGPRTPPPPPKEFRADHPFLFVIKHEETGAVLFMGRVLDPTR